MKLKKKLNLIFLSLCFPILAFSQFPSLDDTPTWILEQITFQGVIFDTSYFKLTLSNKLSINGKYWNTIASCSFDEESCNDNLGLVRSEGSKVYFRFNQQQTGFLMYDFSLEEGDSVKVLYPSISSSFNFGKLYVDSTRIRMFGETSRKVLYLRDSLGLDDISPWIDGIGSTNHPFSLLSCVGGGLISCGRSATSCLIIDNDLVFDTERSICQESFRDRRVLYVDQTAENSNLSGSSWKNAFIDLQDALRTAELGMEIWVAAGTYFPTQDSNRSKSFIIPKGVKLYGGFEGGETSLNQRNIIANPSILNGNIGDLVDSTDNSFHVVQMINVDQNTTIDGFIIEKGFAQVENNNLTEISGGGIQVIYDQNTPSSWPNIERCIIRNNVAGLGAGLYIRTVRTTSESFKLNNCQFINNRALTFGGGLYKEGASLPSVIDIIEDCTFEQNNALFGGGLGIIESSAQTIIKNCSFLKNKAQSSSGSIEFRKSSGSAAYIIEDCEFLGNSGGSSGALGAFIISADIEFSVINSNFEKNRSLQAAGGACLFLNAGGNLKLNVRHTTFEENIGNTRGGGIDIEDSGGGTSKLNVYNSIFKLNSNAINYTSLFPGDEAVHEAQIFNSLFVNQVNGGYQIYNPHKARTYFVNCTFVNNGPYSIRKNWSSDFNQSDLWNEVFISNSILYEQQLSQVNYIISNSSPNNSGILQDYFVSYSLFNTPNCTIPGRPINICNNGNLFNSDPYFNNPVTDDYSLKACSPGINAGSKSSMFEILNEGIDLNGDPRLLEGSIDMGAFEQRKLVFKLEVVKLPNCSDTNDGLIQFSVSDEIPYEIRWNDTLISQPVIEQVSAGQYDFILFTEQECTDTITYKVDAPNPIQLDFTVVPAQTLTSSNGAVVVNSVGGGTPPYKFEVSKNDSIFSLFGLAPGSYELLITDNLNCVFRDSFNISISTNTNNFEKVKDIKVFPNPIERGGTLNVESLLDDPIMGWNLLSLDGQIVIEGQWNNDQSKEIPVKNWKSGFYMLRMFTNKSKVIFIPIIIF